MQRALHDLPPGRGQHHERVVADALHALRPRHEQVQYLFLRALCYAFAQPAQDLDDRLLGDSHRAVWRPRRSRGRERSQRLLELLRCGLRRRALHHHIRDSAAK
eukprot:6660854-Prymnesium_polylepis.1